jgi:hypothetical protein
MLPDTKAVPSVRQVFEGFICLLADTIQTLQLLITDACEITDADYVKLAEDLLKEFENKEVHPVSHEMALVQSGLIPDRSVVTCLGHEALKLSLP